MRVAVLRVGGAALDPTAFLARHALRGARSWRAGDPDRRGRPMPEAGFAVDVADAGSESELAAEIGRFLDAHAPMLRALAAETARAELDIGVTVGTEAQFTASVTLAPRLLARLAECGVTLRVSCYPASDDEA